MRPGRHRPTGRRSERNRGVEGEAGEDYQDHLIRTRSHLCKGSLFVFYVSCSASNRSDRKGVQTQLVRTIPVSWGRFHGLVSLFGSLPPLRRTVGHRRDHHRVALDPSHAPANDCGRGEVGPDQVVTVGPDGVDTATHASNRRSCIPRGWIDHGLLSCRTDRVHCGSPPPKTAITGRRALASAARAIRRSVDMSRGLSVGVPEGWVCQSPR